MNGIRVLIVDDSADCADSMALFFEFEGYDVQVARDGASGVSTAEEFKPELVFMDLRMPGIDGYEAARRMRALPTGGECRLIALSGLIEDGDALKARESGFDRHLCKPVSPDDLRKLLEELRSP